MSPSWVYVYAGTPIKAVIGRLPVIHLRQLTIKESLALANEGALERSELAEYAGEYGLLFVFTVGNFQSASTEVTFSELKEKYGFAPPQSFLILSTQGKNALDTLCGFAEGENNA